MDIYGIYAVFYFPMLYIMNFPIYFFSEKLDSC